MRRSFLPRKLAVPWLPISLLGIVSLFALIAWILGPDRALLLYTGLCGIGIVFFIAYRHPRLTIVLTFITGTLLDSASWLSFRPQVGSIELRLFDPLFLGMIMAIGLKLFLGDRRILKILIRSMPSLSFLLFWYVYTAFRSIPEYGFVGAFGEFRTYYQFFVIALYIATFFSTRRAQWQLFKLLLILSALLVPWGLYSIPFRPEFSLATLGPNTRFLSSYANLALLWGIVGLYVADRQRLINLRGPLFYALVIGFGALTLFNNHRSVWMSTLVSLVILLFLRRLSPRRQLQVGIGVFIIVIAFSLTPNSLNEEIGGFIQERSSAFTDVEEDRTASWRLLLWQQAISAIQEKPIQGVGLGQNFQLADALGRTITTSPHNEYITLAYHGGIVGLAIYLYFIASLLLKIRSRLLQASLARERAIYFATLTVILVVSLYYIAYTTETDFMTWFFIGLGIAALANDPPDTTQSHAKGLS